MRMPGETTVEKQTYKYHYKNHHCSNPLTSLTQVKILLIVTIVMLWNFLWWCCLYLLSVVDRWNDGEVQNTRRSKASNNAETLVGCWKRKTFN